MRRCLRWTSDGDLHHASEKEEGAILRYPLRQQNVSREPLMLPGLLSTVGERPLEENC